MHTDRLATHEARLRPLLDEWRERTEREERLCLATWTERIGSMIAEQTELRIAGSWIAGPSDLLRIIGQPRRETYHCSLVAWLMDPTSPHGLGVRFLSRLLMRCFPDRRFDPRDLVAVVTGTEVFRADSRDVSRADIVAWAPTFTIVIEAKVDAIEQPRQCDRLFAHFADDPDPLFIYLTPRGRDPKTATGDAADAFVKLDFRSVRRDLIDAVADAAEAFSQAPGHSTIVNYQQTLEVEFPWTLTHPQSSI